MEQVRINCDVSGLKEQISIFENIRVALGLSSDDWIDRLELTWLDYVKIKSGLAMMPEKSLLTISKMVGYSAEAIIAGEIDLDYISEQLSGRPSVVPEEFLVAPYGRCRTTHSSIRFLEFFFNWRLKMDALDRFTIAESAIDNAFAPISIQLITELTEYLAQRQLTPNDFYLMGAYSFFANKESLLASHLSDCDHPVEVLKKMWGECLELFEQNCYYDFKKSSSEKVILEVTSNFEIADILGVEHLGNKHICNLKAGMMSTAPAYMKLPAAFVYETQCVHDGDESCIFHIDLEHTNNALKNRAN